MRNVFLLLLISLFAAFPSGTAYGQEKSVVELKTVVIDAGHGGHDPGATNGKIYEKDITLSVALMLGELIKKNHPSIKVIYTRNNDTFVNLYKRADIANKNNADLFISIHINSAGNSAARGHETFVMGTDMSQSNMEVCKLENSVILLEDDYSSNYQGFDPNNPESYIIFTLLQNAHLQQSMELATLIQKNAASGPITNNRGVKQGNFIVLWKCTMPAVLVELGFLSNQNDMKSLTTKTAQQQIANNIYKAFRTYKKQYDTEIIIPEEQALNRNSGKSGTVTDNSSKTQDKGISAGQEGTFGIQVFTSKTKLPDSAKEFKGWKCRALKNGKTYKYYIGNYKSREEAAKDLTKVRNSFPDAFIIKL